MAAVASPASKKEPTTPIASAPAAEVDRGADGIMVIAASWVLFLMGMLPVVLASIIALPSMMYAPPFPGMERVRAALADGTLLNEATWPYLTTTLAIAGAGAALALGVSRATAPRRTPDNQRASAPAASR